MRWIRHAFLNILRNRRRTMLTVVITSIATTALMVAAGFGLFTYQSLREMAARDSGNIVLTTPGYYDSSEDYPLQLGMEGFEELQMHYESRDDVKSVLPRIDYTGLASNGDKSTIFVGLGVSTDEFRVMGPSLLLESGSTLAAAKQDDAAPPVMLASGLARNLSMGPGDIVTLLATTTEGALNAIDLVVAGVFSTGVPELDKRLLYSDIETTQSLLDSSKISSLSIYLLDHSKTQAYLDDVSTRQTLFEATPWWSRAFYYEKVKNLYNNIFFVLGVIIASMVFVAISNTMNMAVTERTREIGTLAALGTSDREIVRNFALEGMILGSVGALIGVILSGIIVITLLLLDIRMAPPPGSTMDYPLQLNFSAPMALAIFITLTAICICAAWMAARKSARKPIIEALAHV